MFAKIRILIESTPRSKAMPDGTAHFAMSAHNRFIAYERSKFTHHNVGSFLRK